MADRYRKRLERDVDRWIEAGLIPEDNRTNILDTIAPPLARWSAQGAAAILGAVLLALAALSFVAANWTEIAPLPRFIILLSALSVTYLGAAASMARGNGPLGHALALLGSALFGAGIVLTAQTFNMSSFYQTGLWIWAVGAFATAIVLPSRPVLIFASVLAGTYGIIEGQSLLSPGPVWLYLPIFIGLVIAAWRMGSTVTSNLLGLSFVIWLGHAVNSLDQGYGADLLQVCAYALCAGAVALITARLGGFEIAGMRVLSGWTLGAAAMSLIATQATIDIAGASTGSPQLITVAAGACLVCLVMLAIQTAGNAMDKSAALCLGIAAAGLLALPWIDRWLGEDANLILELILGALVYSASVALILIGARPGAGFIGGIGVAFFVAQSIYVYVNLFGDLLNTASFFAVGGALMIALSIGLTRWRKSMTVSANGGEA